ncbi:MAG: SprT-like domain-containing protein [Bacillota bacterium]|nr:SprT-like domain-containing protein [Bacillota bacterium]
MNRNLYELYGSFNTKYFNNTLPKPSDIIIEWSGRLTASAGVCYPKSYKPIIRLSTHYHEDFPEDIESTLLHEMIHLKIKGHGKDFKNEIIRINSLGGKVNRYSKRRATKKKINWIYKCKSCSKEYERTRKFSNINKYRCGLCKGKLKEIKV